VGGSIGNSHTNADFLSMCHTDRFSGFGKSNGQIANSEDKTQFTVKEPNLEYHNRRLKENSIQYCCLQCHFLYRFFCGLQVQSLLSVGYKVKPKAQKYLVVLYTLFENFPFVVGCRIRGCLLFTKLFYGQEGSEIILVRGRKRKATSTINRKRGRQTPRERGKRQLK